MFQLNFIFHFNLSSSILPHHQICNIQYSLLAIIFYSLPFFQFINLYRQLFLKKVLFAFFQWLLTRLIYSRKYFFFVTFSFQLIASIFHHNCISKLSRCLFSFFSIVYAYDGYTRLRWIYTTQGVYTQRSI